MNSFVAPLSGGPAALDGGLASRLEELGHDLSGDLWSARLLAEDPNAIREVHRSYFAAGASVGISASYQASRSGFERHGFAAAEADRLLRRSVDLVREARELAAAGGASQPMLVAASVGPYGATLHDGSEYRGRYRGVSSDDLVRFHRPRLEVLLSAAPDLLAIETVPDLDEAGAIVEALRQVRAAVPAWLSFSCRDDRYTNAGQDIRSAADIVAEAPELAAIGVNCTSPAHIGGLVRRIRERQPELPLVVYPNAGRVWDPESEAWLGAGLDRLPDEAVAQWFADGAMLVGGCCGLGPAAVAGIAAVAEQRRR